MPKKVRFEAFKYRLLAQASRCNVRKKLHKSLEWQDFLNSLQFEYTSEGKVLIMSSISKTVSLLCDMRDLSLFKRGDNELAVEKQKLGGLIFSLDRIEKNNAEILQIIITKIANMGGFEVDEFSSFIDDAERVFHDDWAKKENASKIDVSRANEVCTAPEMRHIISELGDLTGKRVLDVGCGLGEASVYFAQKGANVTALDLSSGMLKITSDLAKSNGVEVHTHLASADYLGLNSDRKFDVIYAGNLLHHVDIKKTLQQLLSHLAENAVFVSWDPLAYNPVINIYRKFATSVRTDDEHPIKRSDLQYISSKFEFCEQRFFWLTTLVIFVVMALFQFRNPNKERFWKVILNEGSDWEWLYMPLEKLDKLILKYIPFSKWWCWNVVIIARNPKK